MSEHSPVWGTGYGNKRHLIEEGTRKDEGTKRYGRDRYATAACNSTIFLSFFSDGTQPGEGDDVMKKDACPRCAKKANLQTCPTCAGSGTVEAQVENPDQLALLTEKEASGG